MACRSGIAVLFLACLVLAVTPCRAGMGYLPLTEVPHYLHSRTGLATTTRERVETLSFFALGLFASGGVIRLGWNGLRRDFPSLPQLSYGKALGLVGLWGTLFFLVLTMISGARELLTPGAWVKQGFLYRLADEPPPRRDSDPDPLGRQRIEGLTRLRDAIVARATLGDLGCRYPARQALPDAVLEVPGRPGEHYLYVEGRTGFLESELLACEPKGDGLYRYVILGGGEIRLMPEAWVVSELAREVK